MKSFAELSVKGFRAIRSADIELGGITVVAGVNGSGKSTLSKLLYYVFRNANSFEELVLEHVNRQLRPYVNILEQIRTVLWSNGARFTASALPMFLRRLELSSLDESKSFMDLSKKLCDRLIELEDRPQKTKGHIQNNRLKAIIASTLNTDDSKDIRESLDILNHRIEECFHEADKLMAERPYRFLKNSLNSVFDSDLSRKVIVKEFGEPIFGEGLVSVPLPHYFRKVAYMDTPMVVGMDMSAEQPLHWRELNALLKLPPKRGYKWSISNIIKKEIINGDVSYDDDLYSSGFKYSRDDGEEFSLAECATGIKSFAVLHLLLKNQFMDENTLMIIDEPEAHLHPQWIIEYARVLVLLHKRLGVKFFIASHSTDMVSALRYLSEKERCLSDVNFYVAESSRQNSFVFRSLEQDIEPIFESFNKSFERLDYYVDKKEA